jgi:hypothetical protein
VIVKYWSGWFCACDHPETVLRCEAATGIQVGVHYFDVQHHGLGPGASVDLCPTIIPSGGIPVSGPFLSGFFYISGVLS